ncbi:MAG: type VII secretion protein EccCb, partial [Dermatophilaceae bacterium]
VILDGGAVAGSDHLMTDGGVAGVTLIDLTSAAPRLLEPERVLLTVEPSTQAGTSPELAVTTSTGREVVGQADVLGRAPAEALARQISALRLSQASRGAGNSMAVGLGLTQMLGIEDARGIDLASTWAPRPNRDRLRVPIGVGPDGHPVYLDLKESAQDGMGPHGLLIGATGSGKSELLRTMILALAITHDPEQLNLVLVDFKGGATFAQLHKLPHTSAVITNLADELALVDRMTDAINGELVRRQELLRNAGNFVSQRDYEKARASGAPLAPLPSLLIVCDEFSELLTAKPDFIDMFVQIGRVGRSLGVHLLLASQRLDEGRLRGLETHLSYRFGLRTFSASESRSVLGVPDAYELPRAPGHGFLKAGTEGLVRLRTAYVSGAYRSPRERVRASGGREEVFDFSTAYVAVEPDAAEQAEREAEEHDEKEAAREAAEGPDLGVETVLDVIVDELNGKGTPAHRVWLPPLGQPPTLDQIYPNLRVDPRLGLTAAPDSRHPSLRAVIGIVDKPLDQRRDPLLVDLSTAAGHFLVVGGPRSGKSTMLRALVTSLALTHTPEQVQFYGLDFGGGSLASLRGLPHVGGVAARSDADAVRRTVGEMSALLRWREQLFGENGVEGMAAYRRAKADGAFTEDPFGDVCLVVDGWQVMRNQFEDLEMAIAELATTGLSFGIHLLAAASRSNDIRTNVRDMFGAKVELRLGDPLDSMVNRRVAITVPENSPGRGVVASEHQILGALPRVDGRTDVESMADGVADLVSRVSRAWPGAPARRVRMLPQVVERDQLPPIAQESAAIPMGLLGDDLSTFAHDFAADPHLLLLADVESGKTNALRLIAQQVTARNTPEQAQLLIVDYRRGLLGEVDPGYQLGHTTTRDATESLVADVCTAMRKRLPGDDTTPEQLRARNWWSGPDLYVLVDDYDLVASPRGNPLEPLAELLPQGRDIGLHLVVARRSGGASRALYESFMRGLLELGTPGVAMSAPADEGKLLGTVKSAPLPPGRGWYVSRRHGQHLVQLAWAAPTT